MWLGIDKLPIPYYGSTQKDTDFFIKVLENIGRRWNSFSVKILNYADDSCLGDKRLSDFLLKHQ